MIEEAEIQEIEIKPPFSEYILESVEEKYFLTRLEAIELIRQYGKKDDPPFIAFQEAKQNLEFTGFEKYHIGFGTQDEIARNISSIGSEWMKFIGSRDTQYGPRILNLALLMLNSDNCTSNCQDISKLKISKLDTSLVFNALFGAYGAIIAQMRAIASNNSESRYIKDKLLGIGELLAPIEYIIGQSGELFQRYKLRKIKFNEPELSTPPKALSTLPYTDPYLFMAKIGIMGNPFIRAGGHLISQYRLR